jgi:hypothetical protein
MILNANATLPNKLVAGNFKCDYGLECILVSGFEEDAHLIEMKIKIINVFYLFIPVLVTNIDQQRKLVHYR